VIWCCKNIDHCEQTIEVPETLLKKRKQNEKVREEKLAAAAAARKVRFPSLYLCSLKPHVLNDGYDFIEEWLAGVYLQCCPQLTIFRD